MSGFRYVFYVVLGIVGEILITISLVLGLFIFWQLYWTSWEVEGVREAAIAEFHKELPPPVEAEGEKRTDDPPAFEKVGHGDTIGVLHVNVWGMQIPIVEGTEPYLLDQAFAGHYPKTQQVGEMGNFVIAGHRRSYGNNFRHVDILNPGQPLVVETKDAWIVYEVDRKEIILPTQTEVTLPVPFEKGIAPTERLMTMTTCSTSTGGQFGNSHRYIVYSKFKYWMPRESGTPEELSTEGAR